MSPEAVRVAGLAGWLGTMQDVLKLDAGDCGYPTVCGQYGLCSSGQCSCPSKETLAYFRPVDNQRINLGCMPVTPLSCQTMQDHRPLVFSGGGGQARLGQGRPWSLPRRPAGEGKEEVTVGGGRGPSEGGRKET